MKHDFVYSSIIVLGIVCFFCLGFILGEMNHDVSLLSGMVEKVPTPVPAHRAKAADFLDWFIEWQQDDGH